MRLAIAADMPALVNVPATAATGISGICRVPSWRIKPKGLLLGRLRLLRLLRLLWLLSSASAWVCRWTTLGIAILQLAATNASEAIAEETCLVNIAGTDNPAKLATRPSCPNCHEWHWELWTSIPSQQLLAFRHQHHLALLCMALGCLATRSHPATQSTWPTQSAHGQQGPKGSQGHPLSKGLANDQQRPLHDSSGPGSATPSTFGCKAWRHTEMNGTGTADRTTNYLSRSSWQAIWWGWSWCLQSKQSCLHSDLTNSSPTIRNRKACFARTFCVKQTDASPRNVTTNPWKHIKMKQLLLVIVAPWPHLTFCWNPAAFFEHVPSPSFSQVHLQVTENHRLTGAVQLQGRCSKGARDLQRTKLWTLQSSQLQNQTSIRDQDISRHVKISRHIKTLSKPKVTNTSGRYQENAELHST